MKNRVSFYDWCYTKFPKNEAETIINRWNCELNIDKDGNKLSPKDVSFASQGIDKKGYWFNCLDYPDEHKPEQKSISNFTNTNQDRNINCQQCNTISTTHPEFVGYLVNPEDALKYSYGSSKKLPMRCIICGHEKPMIINNLIKQGFACPCCSDGKSYPSKFLFSLFTQLYLDFDAELSRTSFNWCENYKYDFHISKIKGIIEANGLQHYKETKGWGNVPLEQTQENDFNKEWFARSNNVNNYIILDCRYSELEWIKNSIMKSRLPKLLNFKEEDIDWLKCHKDSCSSLIKSTCEMWNKIKSVSELVNILKLDKTSITKYLKQGALLGWCDYDPKTEIVKSLALNHKNNSISVICLTTLEVFQSLADASKKYNIKNATTISACCRKKIKHSYAGKHPVTKEKLVWQYYSEYIKLQELQIIIPEESLTTDDSFSISAK